MKSILTAVAILILNFSTAYGYEPIQSAEFLTDIVGIEQDHAFPVESVTLTYIRKCNEVLTNIWMKVVRQNYKELGVTVRPGTVEACTMDQPLWITESVTIQLISEVPTTYGLLQVLETAEPFVPMSGVSVDTFN